MYADKGQISMVTTVSDPVCCIVVGSQSYRLCHAAEMLICVICWTVLLHLQTNRQDIRPVMTAWLVVSIFSGFPYVPISVYTCCISPFASLAIPFAFASLAGLAAAVITMIDFRYWQRNKRSKKHKVQGQNQLMRIEIRILKYRYLC